MSVSLHELRAKHLDNTSLMEVFPEECKPTVSHLASSGRVRQKLCLSPNRGCMDMAEQREKGKGTSGRGLVTGACQAVDSFTCGALKRVFTSVQIKAVVQTPPLTPGTLH